MFDEDEKMIDEEDVGHGESVDEKIEENLNEEEEGDDVVDSEEEEEVVEWFDENNGDVEREDTEFEKEEEIYEEDWKAKYEALSEEYDRKIREFVDKKSKEASEIIERKIREISERYENEFRNKSKYTYSSQFSTLVEIICQFENVIELTTEPTIASYLVGFRMFLTQFSHLLSDLGITEIVPKEGDEFDSEIMSASSVRDVDNEDLDNKITKIITKGYKFHERVIKLSLVEVGKYKPPQE